jgi:hypothetical protein
VGTPDYIAPEVKKNFIKFIKSLWFNIHYILYLLRDNKRVKFNKIYFNKLINKNKFFINIFPALKISFLDLKSS